MTVSNELIDQLLAGYKKPEDLIGENGLLKQLTKRHVERALEAEMTEHLGHAKNASMANTAGNVRNGKSKKTLKGDFGELPIDIPRDRHATGIQRQDLVIEARPPCLVLGHDLRLKAGVAVTWDIDGQLAKVAFEGLFAFAVAGVASGIGHVGIFGVAQVLGHLGFQGALDQTFGQLLEQAVFSDEVFRLFVASEQLVGQFVAYGHGSSFLMFGSFLPFDRLHKI